MDVQRKGNPRWWHYLLTIVGAAAIAVTVVSLYSAIAWESRRGAETLGQRGESVLEAFDAWFPEQPPLEGEYRSVPLVQLPDEFVFPSVKSAFLRDEGLYLDIGRDPVSESVEQRNFIVILKNEDPARVIQGSEGNRHTRLDARIWYIQLRERTENP